MTCIVGIETPDGVVMGADSFIGSGSDRFILSEDTPKVFEVGDYLIGVAGHLRAAQALRYATKLPTPTGDPVSHMVRSVVPAIRAAFDKCGMPKPTIEGTTYDHGSQLLIAFRGRMFVIEMDWQVQRFARDYVAIGSGAIVALASLFSTADKEPIERIDLALRAAVEYDTGVSPPFVLVRGARKRSKR